MTEDTARFKQAGYGDPKPLINIQDTPMLQKVLNCMSPSIEHKYIFVMSKEHYTPELHTGLSNSATVISVQENLNEANAASMAVGALNNNEPLLVVPSDFLITMKIDDFLNAVKDYDGGILTFPSNRGDYTYTLADSTGKATGMLAGPVTNTGAEHANLGVYYYKTGSNFVASLYGSVAQGGICLAEVCNEFIAKGANVKVVEISANWIYSLRTPEDLKWYLEIQSNKAERELTWWKEYISQVGVDGFLQERNKDWEKFSANLPALKTEVGKGLDLGCGPRSVLEFSGLTFVGQDPLVEYYRQLIDIPVGYVTEYPAEQFDWILFTNVIDHTPDPVGLIKYIYDHLKLGGRLYFEVNFDYALTAPHYMLWNMELVRQHFGMFEVLVEHIEAGEDQYRTKYWAVLRRN